MNLTVNDGKWYDKERSVNFFLLCYEFRQSDYEVFNGWRNLFIVVMLELQFIEKYNMHFYQLRKEKDLKTRSPQFLKLCY